MLTARGLVCQNLAAEVRPRSRSKRNPPSEVYACAGQETPACILKIVHLIFLFSTNFSKRNSADEFLELSSWFFYLARNKIEYSKGT